MAKLRLVLFLLILISIVLLGLAFLYRNASLASVDFFFLDPVHTSVGVLVLSSFVLGGVLGLVVRVPGLVWQRSRFKVQERALERKEREIERLKNEAAKAG